MAFTSTPRGARLARRRPLRLDPTWSRAKTFALARDRLTALPQAT